MLDSSLQPVTGTGLIAIALVLIVACVLVGSLLSKICYPSRGLVAVLVEVVEVEGHVGVLSVRRANGIAGLAVFAQNAGVGVWLEACVLFGRSRRTTVADFTATDCPGLVR